MSQGLDTETAAGEAALSLDAFCRWIPPLLAGGREPEKEVRSERSQRSAGYLAALKSSPRQVPKRPKSQRRPG